MRLCCFNACAGGGKVLTCGNGGSAADALHMAEELIGRYRNNRRSLPAVSLCADATAITCIANDFGYDEVFARQLAGLGAKGDLLVCFTTSGNSINILRALEVARDRGVTSVALLGKDGGKARGQSRFRTHRRQHRYRPHPGGPHAGPARATGRSSSTSSRIDPMPEAPRSKFVMHNVLIVEDDWEFADVLRQVLDHTNCVSEHASNGMEALDKMRSGNYDIIICDLMMPRVDGESFFARGGIKISVPRRPIYFHHRRRQLDAPVLADFIYPTGNVLWKNPSTWRISKTLRELFERDLTHAAHDQVVLRSGAWAGRLAQRPRRRLALVRREWTVSGTNRQSAGVCAAAGCRRMPRRSSLCVSWPRAAT